MARGGSLLAGSWSIAIDPARRDGRIVAESSEPGRRARPVSIPASLDPGFAEALGRAGIESLYTHQLAALETAARSNLVVTSGTASGKSLAFNLPVLDSIARDGMTVQEIGTAICERIHADFTYDAEATSVETTPIEAFRLKRGVCQDFTHVMIVALRSLGIPAGYVSGYLRTIPPPGKERLEGADAMHAWVRVWCGRASGWMEWDPTNNIMAGSDHIRVGYGRDYSDVAPVIGILKSYGSHTTEQAVDVVPVKL